MKLEILQVEVQKLSVKPGDLLFLRFPSYEFKKKELKDFMKAVQKALPDGVSAVVTFGGMSVSQIERSKDE